MRTNYLPQPILMEKAITVLVDNLGITKASEFWTSLGYGNKNYVQLKKKLFQQKTVDELYNNIEQFEKN